MKLRDGNVCQSLVRSLAQMSYNTATSANITAIQNHVQVKVGEEQILNIRNCYDNPLYWSSQVNFHGVCSLQPNSSRLEYLLWIRCCKENYQ